MAKRTMWNRWGKELAEDMELSHSTEYTDPSCRDTIALRFDLAIHDHYEVKVLCEFQRRDQVKRDWCAANNIPLIEIHYSFKDKGEKAFKDELRRQLKSVGIC